MSSTRPETAGKVGDQESAGSTNVFDQDHDAPRSKHGHEEEEEEDTASPRGSDLISTETNSVSGWNICQTDTAPPADQSHGSVTHSC